MTKKIIIFITTMFMLSLYVNAYAAIAEATGEAEIINGDVPSAKTMAISRAKWAALEKVSGVTVKLDTIMNNMQLADEAVKTELSGTIKSFKVIDEGKDGNIYWVTVKADIEPTLAKKTIAGFAKNTSVAVIIPAVLPNGQQEFNQAFTQAVIKELQLKGFEVSSTTSYSDAASRKAFEQADAGNYKALQAISEKTMSPTFLIGTLKVISKGNDTGYGTAKFEIVSGELEWRLIGDIDGRKTLLTAGSESGRSQGAVMADAATNLYKSMAKSAAVKVASETAQIILGTNAKTIRIALKGEADARKLTEMRDDIKNTPFILNVREDGLSSVLADYPERTYYLATFLTRNNKYKVFRMDEKEIILERR